MTENSTGPLADKTVTDLLVTTEAVIRDLGRWEHVYDNGDQCVYRDNRGAPDCLIGHVLYRWGALEQVSEGGALYQLRALGASKAVATVAGAIQAMQDTGSTWGEALECGHIRAARELEVAA